MPRGYRKDGSKIIPPRPPIGSHKGQIPWNKGLKGSGVWLDKHLPLATRLKLSKAKMGIKMSNEFKEKCRQRQLGKKLSEKTKAKLSTINIGRKHSEESKEKMKENNARAMLGKTHTKEARLRIGLASKKRMLGSKLSEETKRRISMATIGKYKGKEPGTYYKKTKAEISWAKNKRNRVIKRLKIESKSHTYGDWDLLKKQHNLTCPCCNLSEPEIKLTEDHIIPLSKGGSDLIENIQPLCLRCNIKKHTKIIKY